MKQIMRIKDEVTGLWHILTEGVSEIGRDVRSGHYQIPIFPEASCESKDKEIEEILRERIHIYSLVVSRNHARIDFDGKRITYEDISKRGTYINGGKIESYKKIEIFPGDLLTLGGRTKLRSVEELIPNKNNQSQLYSVGYPLRIITGSTEITD